MGTHRQHHVQPLSKWSKILLFAIGSTTLHISVRAFPIKNNVNVNSTNHINNFDPRQIPKINELWEGWETQTTTVTIYTTVSDAGDGPPPEPTGEQDTGQQEPTSTSSIPLTVTVTEYPSSITPPEVATQTTLVTVPPGGIVTDDDGETFSQVTVTTTWNPCSLAMVTDTVDPDQLTSMDFQTLSELAVTDSGDATTTLSGDDLSNYLEMCPTPYPQSDGDDNDDNGDANSALQTASPEQQREGICLDDDADIVVGGGLKPTYTQTTTLYVMAIMLLGTLVGWHLWLVRVIIYPLKLVVVSWHELGHAFALVISGVKITSVDVDPKYGGATRTSNAPGEWFAAYPIWVLPMGFLFSASIGGVLVFCGFNTYASKIASFWVGASLLSTIVFAAGITKLVVLAALGLLIGMWFIDHGSALRYYILLMGMMSSFYWIWDTMDDKLHGKQHPCCCMMQSQEFARRGRNIPIASFIAGYAVLCFVIYVAFVLAALYVWRQTSYSMYCQSQAFLPT